MIDTNLVRTANDLERKYLSSLTAVKKATETNTNEIVKTNTSVEKFAEEVTKQFKDVQEQLDGEITTWFYSGVPTLTNLPASQWTTNEEKDKHIADMYYDQSTGYGYRFYKDSTTGAYGWLELSDSAATEALAIANSAKDTADSKRRCFIIEPTTPYDVGDLWIYNQELYRCQIARESGAFQSQDWIKATKYTDDTYAKNVENEMHTNYYTKDEGQSVYALKTNWTTSESSIRGSVTQVKEIADSKARVFRTTPTLPYSVGDLYVTSTNVYVCKVPRTTGTYKASDWEVQVDFGKTTAWSNYTQKLDSVEIDVGKVVEDGEIKSASIIAAINGDTSEVQIDADKISLEGKTINMTSDNIAINSTNFSVDKDGKMKCSNAEISVTDDGTQGIANLEVTSSNGETKVFSDCIYIRNKDNLTTSLNYGLENGYVKDGNSITLVEVSDRICLFGNDGVGFKVYIGKDTNDNGFIKCNDIDLVNNKVLWSGASYMTNGQSVSLSSKVSEQHKGIVLVFSGYSNGEAQNGNWSYTFVPKSHTEYANGAGIFSSLGGTDGIGGYKYIYVYDDRLEGNSCNSGTRTKNGITYNNSDFVLRYVIGV